MKNCTDCILDLTDACPRGAGRATDDSICSCFLDNSDSGAKEDCISRKAAIKAIWDGTNMDIYTSEVKEILEGLPSVQPKAKSEWIPVSEKLPKDGESVLVSYVVHGYPNLYIELGVYTEGKFLRFISHDTVEVFVVKAWMPLPEPYKAEK